MGARLSAASTKVRNKIGWRRRGNEEAVQGFRTYQFKLFEYTCPHCKEKRTIQYFYRHGAFLDQKPRVVCGGCSQSFPPKDIYKTVDYLCPGCDQYRKVRVPARAVPLEHYKSSLVTCDKCWWRGEVPIGRHMELICERCMCKTAHLADVWTENGDSLNVHCPNCQEVTSNIALQNKSTAKKKGAAPAAGTPLLPGQPEEPGLGSEGGAASSEVHGVAPPPAGRRGSKEDMQFTCENCMAVRPLSVEDLIRSQGVCTCTACGWAGCPEDVESVAKNRHRPSNRGKAYPRAMVGVVPRGSKTD